MKKIVLTVLMVFTPLIVHASSLEISTAGTNIGIGTNATTNALSIVGNVGIGTVSNDAAVLLNNSLGPGSIAVAGNVGIGTFNNNGGDAQGNGALSIDPTQNTSVAIGVFTHTPYYPGLQWDLLSSPFSNARVMVLNMPGGNVNTGSNDNMIKMRWNSSNQEILYYSNGTNNYITSKGQNLVIDGQDSSTSDYNIFIPTGTNQNVSIGTNIPGPTQGLLVAGNVGIGTSISGNGLDVAKNVSIGTAYAGYDTAPTNGMLVQGNVGIGTATTNALLQVGGTGNVGVDSASPGQALDVVGVIRQSTEKSCSTGLTTDSTGAINGCVASDESLKNDIEPVKYNPDLVMKLQPVFYKWRDRRMGHDTKIHGGFIAQEVEKIFPFAVLPAGSNLKGIDSNGLLAIVVSEVQDDHKRLRIQEWLNGILILFFIEYLIFRRRKRNEK